MAMYPCLSLPSLSFPTLTGSIVTFNSQYAGLPLKSHTVAVTATQSGSGTPSPSNPRPITGYSAINISHSDADTSNPTVYTIQIGSTVYGGEYDARTGVLRVTHKGVLWSDLNVQTYNGNIYQANVSDILIPTSGPERQQGIMSSNIKVCSTFALNETMEDLSMLKLTNYVYIKISSASTAIEAQAILGSGQLVYELATPQTIQLPPCPIDTLQVNNIWADTGDTTLQYPKFG